MKSHIAIKLTNISKRYTIHHEKPTLVEQFVKRENETFWALKNLSLTIHKGEQIGIIGPNGSGKTTLLKLLAGIANPTQGVIQTVGRVISIIDILAGFHPELNGYQNVFINGMLLGMRRQEVESRMEEIIAFADLAQFIDAPIFTYSSGMALRLGFAVAIHANPDILLLDENMGIGDHNFQNKSFYKLKGLIKMKKTVIIVTHNLTFITKTCKRILQLHKGELVSDGGLELLEQYDSTWKYPSNWGNG